MKKLIKGFASFLLVFFLTIFLSANFAEASTIAAPTLLKINSTKSYSISAPVISGVTPKNTKVQVYVDNVFKGNAVIQQKESTSNSFYFQIFGLKEGKHNLYLIAQDDKTDQKSNQSKVYDFTIDSLPAPTLVVPNSKTITAKIKPLIEGLTKSGSFVHIYIDGVYNGKTSIVENESGTAHFVYSPFLNLNKGNHKIWAVSEDLNGRKSVVSKVMDFKIEAPMPAPTLYEVEQINNATLITGLSKNDSKIKVFVDKKLDGEFLVKNNKSGVANFSYKLKAKLNNKKHIIFATAVDKRGKESSWSTVVYYNPVSKKAIATPASGTSVIKKPEISNEGVIENNNSQKNTSAEENKIIEYLGYADKYSKDKDFRLNNEQYAELEKLLRDENTIGKIKDEEKKNLENLLASKNSEVQKEENEIINDDKEDATNTEKTKGIINESKNNQSAIGWNAIIFVIFLIAVIAWIFWVNRELIKEKQEQIEKEKEENK